MNFLQRLLHRVDDGILKRSEKVEARSVEVLSDAKKASDAWWDGVHRADAVLKPKYADAVKNRPPKSHTP